jgi:hypothetical protein
MAGTQTDLRIAADNRLAAAKKAGVSGNDLAALQAARDVARNAELSATGGNRQAGER